MKSIKIEVTLEELLLATTLLSDQLFRREFIDPKMPGYKRQPSEVAMGKALVLRLKAVAQDASEVAAIAQSKRSTSHLFPNRNGVPDAV